MYRKKIQSAHVRLRLRLIIQVLNRKLSSTFQLIGRKDKLLAVEAMLSERLHGRWSWATKFWFEFPCKRQISKNKCVSVDRRQTAMLCVSASWSSTFLELKWIQRNIEHRRETIPNSTRFAAATSSEQSPREEVKCPIYRLQMCVSTWSCESGRGLQPAWQTRAKSLRYCFSKRLCCLALFGKQTTWP